MITEKAEGEIAVQSILVVSSVMQKRVNKYDSVNLHTAKEEGDLEKGYVMGCLLERYI